MIHYPHPHNEEIHNRNINEWWACETNKYLQEKLRNLVVRANWNKRIICRIHLSKNDLEIHQNRFDGYISQLTNIAKQLKAIGKQYNPSRIESIKKSLYIIRNYENKTISRQV